MNVEETDIRPAVDFSRPGAVMPMAHGDQVTGVLINDGRWYNIVKGSFHFYRTSEKKGAAGVPFIQFDVVNDGSFDTLESVSRMQVFPPAVLGWRFNRPEVKTDDEGE